MGLTQSRVARLELIAFADWEAAVTDVLLCLLVSWGRGKRTSVHF